VSHLLNTSAIESIGNLTEIFANNSAITDLLNDLTIAMNASELLLGHNSTASSIAQFLIGNETLVNGMIDALAVTNVSDNGINDNDDDPPNDDVLSLEARVPRVCTLTAAAVDKMKSCTCDSPVVISDDSAGNGTTLSTSPTMHLASCDTLACLNGGMYLSLTSGLCGCVCARGYGGRDCSALIDKRLCRCANGGRCVVVKQLDEPDAFACECPLGFLGAHCQYSISQIQYTEAKRITRNLANELLQLDRLVLCTSDDEPYCQHNGLCMEDVVTNTKTCYCVDNWMGPRCDNRR